MTFIIFVLILSVLVLVHEFGHFIIAKKNGIRVEEFGWGLPPRIFGKKFGDTLYSINALPLGGFVKLTGEDLEDDASQESVVDNRSFASKTPLQRAAVLVAGVSMNILLAITLFYLYFFFTGFKTDQLPLFFDYKFRFGTEQPLGTVVAGFQDGSPASVAGLELGDAILTLDGVSVHNVSDIHKVLAGKAGTNVALTYIDVKQNNSAEKSIVVVPTLDPAGAEVIGVYLTKSVSIAYTKPIDRLFAGPMHAYNMLAYSGATLGKMIGLSVDTKSMAPVSQSVAGPVGIYQVVGGILKFGGARAWLTLLDFTALMSLSLAFINIMPFPALDGGRLAFVFLEILRKKPISPKKEVLVHKIGMAILLSFILLVTLKDIFKW